MQTNCFADITFNFLMCTDLVFLGGLSANSNVCLQNQLNQHKETSYNRLLSSTVQAGNAVIWLKLPNPAEASAYIVQL